MRLLLFVTTALVATAPAHAQAADEAIAAKDSALTLGQIVVTAPHSEDITIGTETLSSEAIYTFNRDTLDEAVNLMPGVTSANSGGSRNERLIFVRGFDRFQVPVSLDGIRVYLSADNRLDYGRFLTPDIAEIQVAKGYASVLDGPGAMGGAINLVTRKPTKALEAEARATIDLDRDVDYAGYNVFALLGTRQEKFYAQASYTRNFWDHWDLAGGYDPALGSAEDGGARDFSWTRDRGVNGKFAGGGLRLARPQEGRGIYHLLHLAGAPVRISADQRFGVQLAGPDRISPRRCDTPACERLAPFAFPDDL